MSFFHYNIAESFFCYIIERHRIWKEWKKYSITKDFEAFIYCDKGIYKSIKILGWNSERSSMLHPKGTWRIFDKEKSDIFSNDFANGKIDTIMGLATLSQHLRKSGFSTKNSNSEIILYAYQFSWQALHLCPQTQNTAHLFRDMPCF